MVVLWIHQIKNFEKLFPWNDSCLFLQWNFHFQKRQSTHDIGSFLHLSILIKTSLDVYLDVLLVVVSVEIQHEIVNKIESVANYDERKLIVQLGLLEESLDFLGVVAVALSADSLHFFDLARLAGSLDVLEMHICVLAEVHYGSEEVEQAWNQTKIRTF